MAYYRLCERCGCTMDCMEGIKYPGEGLVCEECAEKLDREAAYARRWSMSREQVRELMDKFPDLWETA